MKKLFTLTMLLVLAMTAGAQETYRKSWNFTKWSATTVANLKAESAKGPTTGAWSDVEKATATEPTEVSKDNCFWEVTAQGNATEGTTLMANGEVIPELQGLLYTNTTARSLAIAVNYQVANPSDAAFGPYQGASYLWLGSKTKNYFVIPHVAPGTTIKMGVESHKTSEARGVELYVGVGNGGTKLNGPDGNAVTAPKTYLDQEWLLPAEGLTDTPNEDGTFDITIRNTNGCHIYYITVGEGDSPAVEEAKKVAYLTPAGADLDADFAYIYMSGSDGIELTQVDVATATLESLAEYDAAVVAPSVTAADADKVKALIAYFPVVNLSSDIYAAMGYGKAVATEATSLTIADAANAIFEGIDELAYEGAVTGVELGDYFKADAVLAKAGETVAVHAHNAGRNAYYFIPTANAGSESAVFQTLIPQTVLAAAKTKRDITAVGTPAITFKQEDGASIVTITATNSNAIYYTIDGTDPTTASTLYAEPFTLTAPATVKALATGDGYNDSQIGSKDVTIASKLATPAIAIAREAGKSTVTITAAEGTTIYYNYTGSTTLTESKIYSEPIVVTSPLTITAFATAENFLNSDKAQQFVGVDGVDKTNLRWDIMAHFNANADNWKGKGQQTDDGGNIINANYFFTWGKNAGQYWDETSAETIKASDGVTDSTIYTKTLAPETYEAEGWRIKSIGQVMVWENLSVGYNIGDTSMRNPDTAEDAIGVNDSIGITPNALTFGKQPTGGPFNASLETTVKYQAPFDVIVYAGNGNDGEIPTMQVEVSADGENWTKLGDVAYSLIKRNWKKTQLSYEGTDEVYVRILHTAAKSSGQVYDVYLMNNGEKSQQYNEETAAGIAAVKPAAAKAAAVYSLNGTRRQGLKRGLNIVVEDGVAKKILVK